jgi:hypothetical protein
VTGPGFVARIGLAISHPRWALTVAVDRRHAGRSGTDLIAVIAIVLLATVMRELFAASWIGVSVAPVLGLRAFVHVIVQALTIKLAFLVVAAIGLWLLSGEKRNLGRAFDLACVAALPLMFVELVATVVMRAAAMHLSHVASVVLAGLAFAWAGSAR